MALGLLADTTTLTVALVAAAVVAAVAGWVALRLRRPDSGPVPDHTQLRRTQRRA